MTGGSSSANVAVPDGALVVTGEIAPGLPFPWEGVIRIPGKHPMDLSGREVFRFPHAGDAREFEVMLISRPTLAGPPTTVTFIATEEWTRSGVRWRISQRSRRKSLRPGVCGRKAGGHLHDARWMRWS